MPVYEYECDQCGRVQEAFQKMSDPPLETCEHCKGKLHKLISQSSFHLKGSGWYVTDYGKGGAKSSAATSSSDSKKASKTSSAS